MRESFVIHSEYIEDLPKDYKTKFLVYVYNFGIHGIEPKCDGLELSLWKKIKRRIELDSVNYRISSLNNRIKGIEYRIKNDKASETDKANLEAYKKELKDLKPFKTISNGSKEFETVLTYTPGVSVSDIDTVIDNDIDIVIDNVSVSDIDNDSVVVVVDEKGSKAATTTTTFVKPSFEEVENFIKAKNLNVNAEYFYNFYESSDWELVTNWKKCLLSWDKNEKKDNVRIEETKNDKWWEKK